MDNRLFNGMTTYGSQRGRLIEFVRRGLMESGCTDIKHSIITQAPYVVSYISPFGFREGIICYLTTISKRATRNRPSNEARLQLKFGSKIEGSANALDLYFDPFRVYTTLLLGIDEEDDIIVSLDPAFHNGRKMFTNYAYKFSDEEEILNQGLHIWERSTRLDTKEEDEADLVLGCTVDNFYTIVDFERSVAGLDFGQRSLFGRLMIDKHLQGDELFNASANHPLEDQYGLDYREILDLVSKAPRLLTAVRGQVAEKHLHAELNALPDIEDLKWLEKDGQPDFFVKLRGLDPITLECKNTSPSFYRGSTFKVDFQRTRSSKTACSRYYSSGDFDVLAACTYPLYSAWKFQYILTEKLPTRGQFRDRNYDCPAHIHQTVHGQLGFMPTLPDALRE